MDPFIEKELIEILKSINLNIRDVKNELCEIKLAIRESGDVVEDDEDAKGNFEGEDVEEEEAEEDEKNDEADEKLGL
jgi:hypothetical protein